MGDSDLSPHFFSWGIARHVKRHVARPARPFARYNTAALLVARDSQYLSSLIYTASALHSAVNFPQQPLTSYVPNTPAAVYQPLPTDKVRSVRQSCVMLLACCEKALDGMHRVWRGSTVKTWRELPVVF